MGHSTMSKYRVEYRVRGSHWTPASWLVSSRDQRHADGRPTDENLRRHVEAIEASTRPGGVNAHLGATVILSAKLINQHTDETVAAYVAPAFQAVS